MHSMTEKGLPSIMTVFSAPNYCDTYGNKGAVFYYDGDKVSVEPSSVYHPHHQVTGQCASILPRSSSVRACESSG